MKKERDVHTAMDVRQGGSSELFDRMRIKQSSHNNASPSTVSLADDLDTYVTPQGSSFNEQPSSEAPSPPIPVSPQEDNSTMAPEARRSLVYLLRQGVLLASLKSKLFGSLCRHQNDIRRHLAEVYLKLVLDEKTGVAFVSVMQKEEEAELEDFAETEVVSLITRRTLSLYDTLLLLVLRKHYQDRETAGEQLIVIDQERVASDLSPFLPLTNSSKSDRRKLGPALERMVNKKILKKIRGSKDRYEITPVIRYVVNAEFLEQMLGEYKRLAEENNISTVNDLGQSMSGEDDE